MNSVLHIVKGILENIAHRLNQVALAQSYTEKKAIVARFFFNDKIFIYYS
jgi:hypothetical protein